MDRYRSRAIVCIPVMAGFVLFFTLISRADDCDQAARFSGEASRILGQNPAGAEERLIEAVALCPKSAALSFNLAMVKTLVGTSYIYALHRFSTIRLINLIKA